MSTWPGRTPLLVVREGKYTPACIFGISHPADHAYCKQKIPAQRVKRLHEIFHKLIIVKGGVGTVGPSLFFIVIADNTGNNGPGNYA